MCETHFEVARQSHRTKLLGVGLDTMFEWVRRRLELKYLLAIFKRGGGRRICAFVFFAWKRWFVGVKGKKKTLLVCWMSVARRQMRVQFQTWKDSAERALLFEKAFESFKWVVASTKRVRVGS